MEGKLMMTFSV